MSPSLPSAGSSFFLTKHLLQSSRALRLQKHPQASHSLIFEILHFRGKYSCTTVAWQKPTLLEPFTSDHHTPILSGPLRAHGDLNSIGPGIHGIVPPKRLRQSSDRCLKRGQSVTISFSLSKYRGHLVPSFKKLLRFLFCLRDPDAQYSRLSDRVSKRSVVTFRSLQ